MSPACRLALLCAAALAAAPGGAAELTRRQKGDLAIEARGILRTFCGECHSGAEPATGRLSVTDHPVLVGNAGPVPFVARAAGGRSQVVEFLEDGSMPPGGRPRPTPAQIDTIKRWIAAGAPGYPVAFDDATTLAAVLDDFNAQPGTDRPFLRYLSLAHLVPADGPLTGLKQAEDDLGKALAAAADGAMKKPPEPVNDTATVFRLDLRAVGWHHRELFERLVENANPDAVPLIPFDLILLEYPHDHPATGGAAGRTAMAVKEMNNHRGGEPSLAPAPFLRGDWLANALLDRGTPTPLANDLTALVRLAAALKDGKPLPPGPKYSPFVTGKPLTGTRPPLGSWAATGVSADPPPFTFTAALVNTDKEPKPVAGLTVGQEFRIRATCDKTVRLTLLRVFGDVSNGSVEAAKIVDIAQGNVMTADNPKTVFPDTKSAFTAPPFPMALKESAAHYVLFASDADRPPPAVVRSKHAGTPIWRFLPAEPTTIPTNTARVVLTLKLTRN